MRADKKPTDCTDKEIELFAAMVRAGGEVDCDGLEKRIRAAERLIFLYQNTKLVGVAGIKNPECSYRDFVCKQSGRKKSALRELGWIFIHPDYRGLGLAHHLVKVKGPMFATARTNNLAMRKVLVAQGFKAKGEYPSCRDRQPVTLFVRISFWRKLCEILKK